MGVHDSIGGWERQGVGGSGGLGGVGRGGRLAGIRRVVLDNEENNQVVCIEMLCLSKRAPNLNLSTVEFASA